ncbi:MAG: DNA translocase FtsK [Hyphomicrobiaceae bacterium]|nr:DNA translocase FtsK [Hyphomicrobiaceae bacterium]
MTPYSVGMEGPAVESQGTTPGIRARLSHRIGAFARTVIGYALLSLALMFALSFATWSVADPSLTHAAAGTTRNLMGPLGAIASDLLMQTLGLAGMLTLLPLAFFGLQLTGGKSIANIKLKLLVVPIAILFLAGALSALPTFTSWPLRHGFGGIIGDVILSTLQNILAPINAKRAKAAAGLFYFAIGMALLVRGLGMTKSDVRLLVTPSPRGNTSPTSAWKKKIVAVAAATPILGPKLFGTKPTEVDPQLPGLEQRPQHNLYGQPIYHPYPQPSMHPQGQLQHPGSYPVMAVHPQPQMPQQYHAPAPRAQVYPHPFLRAHPMTANRPLAMLPHPMQPQIHPINQTFVTSHPVVVMPMPAPMPQQQQQHHNHYNAAPQFDAVLRPAPTHTTAPREDIHDTPTEFTFDSADDDSRAMAERFAPRASTSAPSVAHLPTAQIQAEPANLASHIHATAQVPLARQDASADAVATTPPAQFSANPRGADVVPARQRRSEPTRSEPARLGYRTPSITLLKAPPAVRRSFEGNAQTLRGLTKLLLDTLADYGVKGDITAVRPGPVVTLFEFEPARGTKSSRVIGLAEDIARSMSATAVRIAIIPGRNAIGIELPNVTRDTVYLREVIESDAFTNRSMKLPMTLGKTIGGEPVVVDLARMPHLLVAGTTGSGKSVGVNAMILSLLYRLSPAECRLVMIDPKMLELSVYNGIPHLLSPVVTEPGKAVAALNWVVREMEDRYRRMSRLTVRNIDAYNTRLKELTIANEPVTNDDTHMPYIVVVVDEFADLMAVAGKDIEFAVQRLAQMARAAGIHLIMATQRPSVDIITGTIKANFPTRISFRVTSRIDSRTILNEHGAEQLLGQGDMLFAGGNGPTMRVHGPYVSDEEVEAIATYLRASGTPEYVTDLTAIPSDDDNDGSLSDDDDLPEGDDNDLYDRAVAVIVRDQKASTSYLQRRLSIGYNRAADLIERMERDGIVGPANHAGKRDLLSASARPQA